MNIINRIEQLPVHSSKTYKTRSLSIIHHLILHHSGVSNGSPVSYARHHVYTNNWPGIGYHYVIEQDGTILKCQKMTTISYHTGGYNTHSIGLCLTGDYSRNTPPPRQLRSTYQLVRQLMQTFSINKDKLLGHRECEGHASNVCPGFDMNEFRKNLTSFSHD
ncbi:N-acetylmuramoyl-L-alanine amidase [Alteribacillus sp. JSM 102045]|uniref:peptidoglycan recognition protein family protein n=1 Tax=Alteribacillus sp. JSM 102045 TaxID=1562101 RepID=UPI0035C16F1E